MQRPFSRRTDWDTSESEWARLLVERRRSGMPVYDLTESNPTRCGFHYDEKAILSALADPESLGYNPDPRGIRKAREAVAGYYADHSAIIDLDRVFLTTSTSEAYSFLFRLLCDPGDEVLIAQPSYPLFDFLADLDDVRLVPYPLFYDHGWHLDPEALRRKITPRTRAIAVVHPNNPTGHFTKPAERSILESICAEHGLALIVDEVFLDYPLPESAATDRGTFLSGEHPVLTFVLSGLSKIAALPQMKAAWIACAGPALDLNPAISRLEVIADTFLSMSAPVQLAMPDWLAGRHRLQSQIRDRTTSNLAFLDGSIAQSGTQSQSRFVAGKNAVSRLVAEGGWYAVLRIPALPEPDQNVTISMLKRAVAVHSGHFFGLPGAGWLIASLLPVPEEFGSGISEILAYSQLVLEHAR